jgi:hypothetical protein
LRVWAKTMERVKTLESQHGRTSRSNGERYAETVANGTGETLLCTFPLWSKAETYKQQCEVVDGKEGVGGGHSTDEHEDNTTSWREGPLLCSQVERR